MFTIAIVVALTALAFWNGPQVYALKITSKENVAKTALLFIAMFCSIFFSLVWSSYILSLAFCFVEFSAMSLFFFDTFPMYGLRGKEDPAEAAKK